MAMSFEAYLKAADFQLGSDASTTCSRPGSDSSLTTKRSTLTRTPLSAQSKPFVSRHGLSSQAQPFVSNHRLIPMVVMMPAPQDYSEEAQEDVYLACAGEAETLAPKAYSETLQEDVYLGDAPSAWPSAFSARLGQLRGRAPWRDTLEARTFSRTPSPESASVIFSEVTAAAESLCQAADSNKKPPPPVRHTFIHYDTSEHGDAPAEACIQAMTRSSSAPGILLTDSFQVTKVETMAELHLRGKCSPCAYFYHKQDGCRWGTECAFCHDCPSTEIKRRKKVKAQAMMQNRRRLLELEAVATTVAATTTIKGAVLKEQKWCDVDQNDSD